jgi:hypothetical protein
MSAMSSVLRIAKSRTGPYLPNVVDGPISIFIFWPETPRQRACHEQGHCHDARSKHQAKVQVFSDERPHLTLPLFPSNNVGSLFDLVQETQSEQCRCEKKKKNEHCLHLGLLHVCLFWSRGH